MKARDVTVNLRGVGFIIMAALSATLLWAEAMAQATSSEPYGQPSTARGDWPLYFPDPTGSNFSPLNQIDASNFNKLEVAWRLKTDVFGAHPEYKLEGTPLAINGTICTTAGSRSVAARSYTPMTR